MAKLPYSARNRNGHLRWSTRDRVVGGMDLKSVGIPILFVSLELSGARALYEDYLMNVSEV